MSIESALVVNVEQLLAQHGLRKPLRLEEALDDLSVDLARVDPARPVTFDLVLEAIEGDAIVVTGQISGEHVETCRRCLKETERTFSCVVREVFRQPSDVWEEGYVVADEQIDLRPMINDNVLLELPADPVCRDDCQGLCTRCGVNRNERGCSCTVEEGDLRWAVLRDLLEPS